MSRAATIERRDAQEIGKRETAMFTKLSLAALIAAAVTLSAPEQR
jgi:hypothetical protein